MGESPRDNVVVCDVHQESMSSSSDSDKTHTKNFSSGDFSPYGKLILHISFIIEIFLYLNCTFLQFYKFF